MSSQVYINGSEETASRQMDTEERNESSEELTAAAALTSIGGVSRVAGQNFCLSEADEEVTDHDEEEEAASTYGTEFSIPQRFTKSGRKRAVPFPFKVSLCRFASFAFGNAQILYDNHHRRPNHVC